MRAGAVAATAAATTAAYRWFNPKIDIVNEASTPANLKQRDESEGTEQIRGWQTGRRRKRPSQTSSATTTFTGIHDGQSDVLQRSREIFKLMDGKSRLMALWKNPKLFTVDQITLNLPTGRANLSNAMRGGMVHGYSMGRRASRSDT